MKCPQCKKEMLDLSYISMDHGRGCIEMVRFDCPDEECDTTVLIGDTSEMGDEDEDEKLLCKICREVVTEKNMRTHLESHHPHAQVFSTAEVWEQFESV